jgi:hypothetical protein
MKKSLALVALLAVPFWACSGKSLEDSAKEQDVERGRKVAQEVAQDIQGPWGQFHQWTVGYSMKAPAGGTILLDVRNEKGLDVLFTIESSHRFYREWYALGKGQTTVLFYMDSCGQGPCDIGNYLAPDSGRVREETKKGLAGGWVLPPT